MKFLLFSLFICLNLQAHTLLLKVIDNKDNTITIIGGFDNLQKAQGAMVRLESLISGEVLYKNRLPYESKLTIPIPKEEYQIVLDGGPEEQLVQKGIAPLEGFKIKASKEVLDKLSQPRHEEHDLGITLIIFLFIGLILLLLTLYFSYKNTKKLLEEIKNK